MQFYINEFAVNKYSKSTHSYIIENDWILYRGDSSAHYKNDIMVLDIITTR